jgi:hypothetical protein
VSHCHRGGHLRRRLQRVPRFMHLRVSATTIGNCQYGRVVLTMPFQGTSKLWVFFMARHPLLGASTRATLCPCGAPTRNAIYRRLSRSLAEEQNVF